MNTKKLFMLLAAVLLSSASAMAQSGNNEPLKGDVNEDGVVDVADIAALIAIIKNNAAPQTTYYWYVGTTTPSTIDTSDIKTSETEIGWHIFTEGTTSLHIGEVSNATKVYWVVLVPENSGLVNVVDAGEILGGYTVSHNITIGGTQFTKIVQDNPTKKFDYDITK